jgi:type II secretory pathway pseudopilin PulG
MQKTRQKRAGFTLVEMLVAVGLVVLMMVLFATVFQIATGTMSKQKGLAENDQKARLVQTMIMGDLQKRTFRNVWPWMGEEDGTSIRIPASYRQGYFYISENDPTDDTDDVIQFTIAVFHQQKNKDVSPLYGKSVPLKHTNSSDTVNEYAEANATQPEFDDGQATVNFTSSSTVGEVAYFLRNGVLYRRLMLVRTPFVESTDGTGNPRGPDPNNMNAESDLMNAPYVPDAMGNPPAYAPSASGVFARDFDFSAVNLHAIDSMLPNRPTFAVASTSGQNWLDNSFQASGLVQSLGMPNMRWGFRIESTGTDAGKPREYVDHYKTTVTGTSQGARQFMGRFTQEETSHSGFNYPGTYIDADSCPYTNPDLTLVLDRGVIDELRYTGAGGSTRRGEDILMTSVHAFDIRVYDDLPPLERFVNIGSTKPEDKDADSDPVCNYCLDANEDDQEFGPHPDDEKEKNNVYDTWHPSFKNDGVDSTPPVKPPYRPWDKGPDGVWGKAADLPTFNGDDDGNGMVDDIEERGFLGSDDRPRPLRAIQFHLRYVDPVSNQMRDLTIVHSLID